MRRQRLIAYYIIEAAPEEWLLSDPLQPETWPKSTLISIWEGDTAPNPLEYLITWR